MPPPTTTEHSQPRQTSPASAFQRTDFDEPSVFRPEAMLRETRRQRHLAPGNVPAVCLLDPDGDVVRHLVHSGRGTRSAVWACYHTELWEASVDDIEIGVVGCAIGASFAVLVAEQLFASGCEFLVSITSAGQIAPDLPDPCMILIERAIRGEGTSAAYVPASLAIDAHPDLVAAIDSSLRTSAISVIRGTTWTKDAPYRETPSFLERARSDGAMAVEMEASGLYAFAAARKRPVICFAHVTNTMAVTEGDFEKGPADGVEQALAVLIAAAHGWRLLMAHRNQGQA